SVRPEAGRERTRRAGRLVHASRASRWLNYGAAGRRLHPQDVPPLLGDVHPERGAGARTTGRYRPHLLAEETRRRAIPRRRVARPRGGDVRPGVGAARARPILACPTRGLRVGPGSLRARARPGPRAW